MKRPANCSILLMPITSNDVNACGFDRVVRISYEPSAFLKKMEVYESRDCLAMGELQRQSNLLVFMRSRDK